MSEAYSLGGVKYVCESCRIAFKVHYYRKTVDGEIVAEDIKVGETVPLVESGGWLLTPHDVWREKHKEEYGEYPIEAYG